MKPYIVEVTQKFNVNVMATTAAKAQEQVRNLLKKNGKVLSKGPVDTTTKASQLILRPEKIPLSVSGKIKHILISEGLINPDEYSAFYNDKCKHDRKLKWCHTGYLYNATNGDVNSPEAQEVTKRITKKMDDVGVVYNSAGFIESMDYIAFVVRVPLD